MPPIPPLPPNMQKHHKIHKKVNAHLNEKSPMANAGKKVGIEIQHELQRIDQSKQ